jgi:hypothetical protein
MHCVYTSLRPCFLRRSFCALGAPAATDIPFSCLTSAVITTCILCELDSEHLACSRWLATHSSVTRAPTPICTPKKGPIGQSTKASRAPEFIPPGINEPLFGSDFDLLHHAGALGGVHLGNLLRRALAEASLKSSLFHKLLNRVLQPVQPRPHFLHPIGNALPQVVESSLLPMEERPRTGHQDLRNKNEE